MHATETDSFAPDIKAEMDKLFWCDQLIFQFPLWWFSMPAILKGWIDRVFAMGKIYGGGKWYNNGVFAGRRAMLSVTTGGPPTIYSPSGLNGDLNEILFPINQKPVISTSGRNLKAFLDFSRWSKRSNASK